MDKKMYVISGGPSSGKTTTIQALKKYGTVVPESARDIIEQEIAKGTSIPEHVSSIVFQLDVMNMQIEREDAATGLVFLDRGVPDNLAYQEFYGIQTPQKVLEASKKRKYEKVFLLEMLPQLEKDHVRVETREEALQLEQLIEKHYKMLGHTVIRVPPLSVEERVQFIRDRL